MKKKIIALLSSLAFIAALTTGAAATSLTCSVESIENRNVLLSCGKLADKLKVGEKVKVRTRSKRQPLKSANN